MSIISAYQIKLTDVIPNQYEDFLHYCTIAGRVYTDEITQVDLIAYRSQYGKTKSEIKELRTIIDTGIVLNPIPSSVSAEIPKEERIYTGGKDSAPTPTIEKPIQYYGESERIVQEDTFVNEAEDQSGADSTQKLTYAEIYGISPNGYENISISDDFYSLFEISFSVRV